MKAASHPLRKIFAALPGAGWLTVVTVMIVTGAAYQIGRTTIPDRDYRITAEALENSPGQARTLDDILAESGGEETDDLLRMSSQSSAAGIGGLVARLDRQARTLTVIDEAAARVGAPARLMRAMAGLESGLNTTARASTSSAAGLYQFIETTWLSKVESDGHKYGLGPLARHIRRGPADEPIVDDLRVRDQILALRMDARLSAYLAAELTIDNARRLEKLLERRVTETEIYLSHFFGVTDAARFLRAAESTPEMIGASMFPKEAKANPGIFRIRGNDATLGEIRKRFVRKMAKFGSPDRPAPGDTLAPVQEAALDHDAGLIQVAASAMR
jgi:hypothetical protein